jgi:uncharacterized membrane protein YfcA
MYEIILLVTGAIVGAMNAIAGGGMLIGFPVLVALGIPPIAANATAGIITIPGQISSAIGYRKYLRHVPLKYVVLLVPVAMGAAAGSLLLRQTSAEHFAEIIPLLVFFGVCLFVFQPLLHFRLHTHLKGRSKKILPLVLLCLAVLPIAFYGGYFGAGYGFLMLAFLGMTSLHDTHMMNGMKNISAIAMSVTAVTCLYTSGLIQWRDGLIMAAGCLAGGYIGAVGAQKVSSHKLRLFIICVGLLSVVYLALREY